MDTDHISIVVVVMLIATSGCMLSVSNGIEGQSETELRDDTPEGYVVFETPEKMTVERFIDREAGVVVYVSDRHEAGGIHTVPLNKTALE